MSALQDAGAMRFLDFVELHLDCHTYWLSYFILVCLWCGRTVGQFLVFFFSRIGRLLHFLTHGAPLRFARESSTIIQYKFYVLLIGQKLTTWPANNSLQIMVCSCSMLSQNIVICQCLVDQLFAEAEGWGKQLICSPLTNHDILLNLVQ